MCVGRSRMPADRPYNLGKKGWIYNFIGVAFAAVISVVFFFPGSPDPTAADMNWAIVAFAGLALLALVSWFMGANKRYSVVPTAADLHHE
jgi:choline transport protein